VLFTYISIKGILKLRGNHAKQLPDEKMDAYVEVSMNKAFLIVVSFFLCSQAAMVGDFSPMQVGNKWVYQEGSYVKLNVE